MRKRGKSKKTKTVVVERKRHIGSTKWMPNSNRGQTVRCRTVRVTGHWMGVGWSM